MQNRIVSILVALLLCLLQWTWADEQTSAGPGIVWEKGPLGTTLAQGLSVRRVMTLRRIANFKPEDVGDIQRIQMSGNGKRILLATQRGLFVMNSDATGLRQLSPHHVAQMDISHDGNIVAWYSREKAVEVAEIDGGKIRQLMANPPFGFLEDGLRLTESGKDVFVNAVRFGGAVLRIRTDGSEKPVAVMDITRLRQLLKLPKPDADKINWSGVFDISDDGSKMAIVLGDDAWALSADGTRLTRLSDHSAPSHLHVAAVRISGDGATVVFHDPYAPPQQPNLTVVDWENGRFRAGWSDNLFIQNHLVGFRFVNDGSRLMTFGEGAMRFYDRNPETPRFDVIDDNPRARLPALPGAHHFSTNEDGSKSCLTVDGRHLAVIDHNPQTTGDLPLLHHINVSRRTVPANGGFSLTAQAQVDSPVASVWFQILYPGGPAGRFHFNSNEMKDDGRPPDAVAHDRIYTGTLQTDRDNMQPGPFTIRFCAITTAGDFLAFDVDGVVATDMTRHLDAGESRTVDLRPHVNPFVVYDGNPLFAGGEALKKRSAEDLAKLPVRRDGTTADGVSQLILRFKAPAKGRVQFAIESATAGNDGTLEGLVGEVSKSNPPAAQPTLRTQTPENSAFVLYRPPLEFGDSPPGPVHLYQDTVEAREIAVKVTFTPDGDPRKQTPVVAVYHFELARPPVVLVHGTYGNPKDSWETGDKGPPLLERLRKRGFVVNRVDYTASNGDSKGGPSHFSDNKMVVWDDGHGNGIQPALQFYRNPSLNFAVAQADVVGHSMGGLLPRVYLSDNYNPRNFRRADNFKNGDVHRLITLATTHQGSDLSRLAVALRDARLDANVAWYHDLTATGLLTLADWFKGLNTGASEDQVPGSKALKQIGMTRVPSHAIAVTLPSPDIDYGYSVGFWSACRVLAAQPALFDALFDKLDEPVAKNRLKDQIAVLKERPSSFWEGGLTAHLKNKSGDEWVLTQLFRAALFGNTPNDCVVRLDSQLGGLDKAFTTTISPVLHTSATTDPKVQDRIIELLLGPQSNFTRDGFPPLVVIIDEKHIFEGEIKTDKDGIKRAVGFHHRPGGIDPPNTRLIGTPTPFGTQGAYRGRVELIDPGTGAPVPKRDESTFFPDNWSREKVLAEIEGAFRHKLPSDPKTSVDVWRGVSPSGVMLTGYADDTGKVVTAFPEDPNKPLKDAIPTQESDAGTEE